MCSEEQYRRSINYYFNVSSQSELNNVRLNTVHPLVDALSDFSQQNESLSASLRGTWKALLANGQLSNYNFILCHYTKRDILIDFCDNCFIELAMVPKPNSTVKTKAHVLR